MGDTQHYLTEWVKAGKDRRAFLKWDAKAEEWTVSAYDKETGRSFAWSGLPSVIMRHFDEWVRSG